MKEEIIRLHSRDGSDNKLVRIGKEKSNFYMLISEYDCRVMFNPKDPDDISAIDPSGGPYISIGAIINGYKVKKIYKSYVIEFEDGIFSEPAEHIIQ